MPETTWLATRFETDRPRLRAVAYRMLGSTSDADDAVQEAWLRLSQADTSGVANLSGWLTTVVARVCLDVLRARTSRREESLDTLVPDPIVGVVGQGDAYDAEHQTIMADAVGGALLVVLETLAPAERLAFVLHDLFAVSFDEIAPIVGRSPTAARQLASRARRRVQGASTAPNVDVPRQRAVVDAFLAASRNGDFEALLAVLDPDVVLRLDRGAVPAGATREVRGAQDVIGMGFRFAGDGWLTRPAVVSGAPGVVISRNGRAMSVIGFIVRHDRIVSIDILADPARLGRLDLDAFTN